MNNFSSEKNKLFTLIVVAIIVGVITGYFFESLVFFLAGYILWHFDKLSSYSKWLQKGAQIPEMPIGSGIWARLSSDTVQLRKKILTERLKNQKLKVRFNEILRSFPFPTIVINGRHEIQWINKRAASILSLQRKKDVGIPLNNIIRSEKLLELLKSDDPGELEIDAPRNSNGRIQLTLSRLTRNIRTISIRDISESYRLNAARQSFISNASHELRTPLTIINGYLEILYQNKTLPKSDIEMIQTASEHSQRMSKLIQDLLVLSGLEQDDSKNTLKRNLKFATIINDAIEHLKKSPGYKQKIELKVAKDLQIYASEYQIYSIALNLIENAIKYSPDNSQITITWKKDKDRAIFSVEDQGEGLSEKEIERITQPFYRTKSAQGRMVKGTGLGLSIVHEAARRNEGFLEIMSSPRHGATFKIIFLIGKK
jgi:two-component system phosphate regulon sensor histidine kinase PhoR